MKANLIRLASRHRNGQAELPGLIAPARLDRRPVEGLAVLVQLAGHELVVVTFAQRVADAERGLLEEDDVLGLLVGEQRGHLVAARAVHV